LPRGAWPSDHNPEALPGEDVTGRDGRTFFHPYSGAAPWEVFPQWRVRYYGAAGDVVEPTPHLTRSDAEARARWLVTAAIALSATVEPC